MHPRWNCKNTFLKSSIFSTRPKKSELLFAFDRLLTTSDERNGVSCKILEIWDLNDGRFWKYRICRHWKIYFTIFLPGGRWRTWGGLDQLGGDRQRLGSSRCQGFAGKWSLAGCEDSHHDHWCPLQSPILWFLTSSSLRLRHPFPASLPCQPMSPTTSW